MRISDSIDLRWGLGDFGVWMVARWSNDPADVNAEAQYGALWSKVPSTGSALGFLLMANEDTPKTPLMLLLSGTPGALRYSSSQLGLNDATYRILGLRRVGGQFTIYVGDAETPVTPPSRSVDGVGSDVFIGARPTGTVLVGSRLRGAVTDVLAYKGTVTESQKVEIHKYLRKKYGSLP